MVGRELHTACPNGEDHPGRADDVRKNGDGNTGGAGWSPEDLKSSTRMTVTAKNAPGSWTSAGLVRRVTSYFSPAATWVRARRELDDGPARIDRSRRRRRSTRMKRIRETCS